MTGYPVAKPALKIARAVLAAASAFSDAEVFTKLPLTNLPARFVRLDLVGGTRSLIVTHTARLLVEVWAETSSSTSGIAVVEEMSNDAIAALQNAQGTVVDGAFIRGFDNISGPVDFPDPDIDQWERWQFQGDFHVSTSDTEVLPGS